MLPEPKGLDLEEASRDGSFADDGAMAPAPPNLRPVGA
jgi:hypothetical protein